MKVIRRYTKFGKKWVEVELNGVRITMVEWHPDKNKNQKEYE